MAREMKDSGIEWIGEIPKEWGISKVKYFYDCYDGKRVPVDSAERTPGPYPYWGAGNITDYVNDFLFDEEIILLGEDGAPFFDHTRPVAFLINERIWVNNHIHVLKPKKSVISRFLVYWLNNVDYKSYINGSILNKLTQSNMNSIAFAIPSLAEQQQISDLLDDQCSHIDSVIKKTRAAIEEYKRLKQSVITQAVTKGIRANREMKDSGIEWIGEIPINWKLIPFRHVLNERTEKNVPVRSTERLSLSIDLGVTLYSEKTTNLDRFKDDFEQYKLAHEGDLVMNSMNMIVGATGVSPYYGCVSPAYYTFFDDTQNHITAKFCEYIFRSKSMLRVLFSLGKGIYAIVRGNDRVNTCRLKVSRDDLRSIQLPIPSIDEQSEIVAYLNEKTAAIDSLIQKKEHLISELEAYKKSLIYEYVTGKKEVKADITVEYSTEFKKALLMCRILELTQCKGRIHLQKTFFAIDTLLNLFSTQYYRFEHGPYDLDIESYEKIIEENGWLNIYVGKSIRYNKTNTFSDYFREYEKVFGDRDDIIQRICKVFNVPSTKKAEKIATLLAVWNDFLINGIEPTDDMIIDDVITNWTPNKANVSRETWSEFISKIRENNIVPKGYGKHTKRMEELVNGKKL